MSILQELLSLNEGKKPFKLTTPGWYVVDDTDLPVDGPYQEKGAIEKAKEMGEEYATLHFSQSDIDDILDEAIKLSEGEDLDDLVNKFFDSVGHSLEGRKGLTNFCHLVSILGYKDSNHYGQLSSKASIGDLINFLEDNSGAFEAMVEFINDRASAEWKEKLEEYFAEQGGAPVEEAFDNLIPTKYYVHYASGIIIAGPMDEADAKKKVKEYVDGGNKDVTYSLGSELKEDLEEKVFDESQYDWYVWTERRPSPMIERRGGSMQLERGVIFGLRRATSKKDGTYRLVVKARGPSIIYSIPDRLANSLMDAAAKAR